MASCWTNWRRAGSSSRWISTFIAFLHRYVHRSWHQLLAAILLCCPNVLVSSKPCLQNRLASVLSFGSLRQLQLGQMHADDTLTRVLERVTSLQASEDSRSLGIVTERIQYEMFRGQKYAGDALARVRQRLISLQVNQSSGCPSKSFPVFYSAVVSGQTYAEVDWSYGRSPVCRWTSTSVIMLPCMITCMQHWYCRGSWTVRLFRALTVLSCLSIALQGLALGMVRCGRRRFDDKWRIIGEYMNLRTLRIDCTGCNLPLRPLPGG